MTTVIKKDAYRKMKQVIESRGIKNKFIANKIGVSSSYFSQVLNGTRPLSTDVAIKTSWALDLPTDYFLSKS